MAAAAAAAAPNGGASFGGAPIVENGHGSQLEKVPPRLRWCGGSDGGGRRPEAGGCDVYEMETN